MGNNENSKVEMVKSVLGVAVEVISLVLTVAGAGQSAVSISEKIKNIKK